MWRLRLLRHCFQGLRCTPIVRPLASLSGIAYKHSNKLNSNKFLSSVLFSQRSQSRTMSDDAYAAFLTKANKDYSGDSDLGITAVSIKDVEDKNPSLEIRSLGSRFYTSETDSEFVAVSIDYSGDKLPNTETDVLSDLLGLKEQELIIVDNWDQRNMYSDVTNAVKAAGNGSLKIYVLETGTTSKYWILSIGKGTHAGKLVGVEVEAVYS